MRTIELFCRQSSELKNRIHVFGDEKKSKTQRGKSMTLFGAFWYVDTTNICYRDGQETIETVFRYFFHLGWNVECHRIWFFALVPFGMLFCCYSFFLRDGQCRNLLYCCPKRKLNWHEQLVLSRRSSFWMLQHHNSFVSADWPTDVKKKQKEQKPGVFRCVSHENQFIKWPREIITTGSCFMFRFIARLILFSSLR